MSTALRTDIAQICLWVFLVTGVSLVLAAAIGAVIERGRTDTWWGTDIDDGSGEGK
jgi:hypothetical protein